MICKNILNNKRPLPLFGALYPQPLKAKVQAGGTKVDVYKHHIVQSFKVIYGKWVESSS